jgi:hypothetical protein
MMRISQNFSFWEIDLRFMGKSGPQAAFSRAFPKTNRVLGKARELPKKSEKKEKKGKNLVPFSLFCYTYSSRGRWKQRLF